jgi:hypothetical protein
MFRPYDHRHGSVFVRAENWMNQGQTYETSLVQHQNPEFLAQPRWWVQDREVLARLGTDAPVAFLVFRDVTRATDERTLLPAFIPFSAVVNKAPLVLFDDSTTPRRQSCLLGNLFAFVCDYCVRQKFGGVSLNFFILKQIPILPPDTYAERCPWAKKQTLEHWISDRVLKLSCTAEDMIPLAEACGFKGSRGDGVHIWKEQERAQLRAELDAAYFLLYGVRREDAEYMLSTFSNTGYLPEDDRPESGEAWAKGSTGEAVLEAFDHLSGLTSA